MQLQDSPRLVRTVRKGFTLIELVVVLLILAIIAGLVIPQVAMLGRSADMAASAKTQADLNNNMQLFFTLQKRWPNGLDSLLDTAQAGYSPASGSGDTQTYGLPISGADGAWMGFTTIGTTVGQLTVISDLSANEARSLTRSGISTIYDHDVAITNSNLSTATNSGRAIAASEKVAGVAVGGSLQGKLVPQGLEPGVRLVAFGIGSRNTAFGKTISNVPVYPGCDGRYYGRYIAVFKVYSSGERATLVGVVDPYGRTPDYTQQQFNESLPDGGRQG